MSMKSNYSIATYEVRTGWVFMKYSIPYTPHKYVPHWIKVNISHKMSPVSVLEIL